MVNKAHWAPRKSMGLNGFVRGILSSHEPEVHRSPCRTPPQALEFNYFSHVFVSFCCALNIWIPHCLKAQLQRVAVLSKGGNWILKMSLLQPPGTSYCMAMRMAGHTMRGSPESGQIEAISASLPASPGPLMSLLPHKRKAALLHCAEVVV